MPVDLFCFLTRYLGELSDSEYEQAVHLDDASREPIVIAKIIYRQRKQYRQRKGEEA